MALTVRTLALCLTLGSFFVPSEGFGAPLPPDAPGLAEDLVLWLRHAEANYDAGTGEWFDSSGKGHHARGPGPVGNIIWATPILSSIDGGGLVDRNLAAVRFAGDANDLLATAPLNEGRGLSRLTIISVYAVTDRDSLTRPLGFGSLAATQNNPGNHFNLASDPSIRKDNGQIGSGSYATSLPVNAPVIRSTRMGAGGIDEWFNAEGTAQKVLTNAGPSFVTSSDQFFLGDLRCGADPVPGFGPAISTARSDLVEVIVYRKALSDSEISGLNDWLIDHLGGPPPPRIEKFRATPALISSGASSTLTWEVKEADTVVLTPSPGTVTARGNSPVSPAATTTYTLTATGPGGTTTAEVTVGVDLPFQPPLLNEIVALNRNSLTDEEGDHSDWIEIRNPNPFHLDLGGYRLADSANVPDPWEFPSGTVLAPDGFLIVFASGKDRRLSGAPLHTDFSLGGEGEDLFLLAPDAATVVTRLLFPRQLPDVSYGPDESGTVRFLPPTPGAPNGSGFAGQVADLRFNLPRGFYDSPQNVSITSATAGAEIRYTLDGSLPGPDHGRIYQDPIPIETTTILRATALKEGFLPSKVETQSYLFLREIIRQPALPVGAPPTWGNRASDYEMDPEVVNDPAYRDEIIAGLKSIPTLSIVVPADEFFHNPRGIYANPRNEGRAWEREVSLEFLHPDDPAHDLQANAGIRIHGNGSRSPGGQPKHSFRLEFRGIYGDPSLHHRLFPESRVERFDSLILRGQNAHGWTRASQIANNVGTSERAQSQYLRDSFARDLMKDMGHHAGESTFVHLYLNGLYWGLYNPVEYPRAAYGASHFGGPEEDYDAINRRTVTTKILDGTFEAWNEMQTLANSGLTTPAKYDEIQNHLDLDNLIDYMLMHQYMGSRDGPEIFNSNNMRALRRSRGDPTTRWIAMPWDMEASMFEIDVTRNVNVDDPNTLVRVYHKLRENPEFRLRYADRVHRHCFRDGTLTPTRTAALWERRAKQIEGAIIGESARWGDYRRPSHPFTRDDEWQQERQRLLTTYFPTRTTFLVDLLRDNGLYPETEAPTLTREDSPVVLRAPEGTIYYSLDGSDPRESWTGRPVGTRYTTSFPLTRTATLKARALSDGEWSALLETTLPVGLPARAGNTAISEIMYHPAGEGEEFIELANLSDVPLDFSGVTFTDGIDVIIPVGTTVPAGGFLVLTQFRNGTALANDGETITLRAADQSLIESFRYRDSAPWPISPDGRGPSLTRLLPPEDGKLATSWRPSVNPGGSPGASDALTFTGDPKADLDGDGLPALLEYAFGSRDTVPDYDITSLFRIGNEGSVLKLRQNLAADDIHWLIEASPDLENWVPADLILQSQNNHFDGTRTLTFVRTSPPSRTKFWRARAVRQ